MDNLSIRSFADETAAATGVEARTVRRDAERGEKVFDGAIQIIKGTSLDTGTYLDKLKKLRREGVFSFGPRIGLARSPAE